MVVELRQLDFFCHNEFERKRQTFCKGLTFSNFTKSPTFTTYLSTSEGRSLLAKHFPVEFSAHWNEKVLDERCAVFLVDTEENPCVLLTAAQNIGLHTRITDISTSTAFIELKNTNLSEGKSQSKIQIKLVCDQGKRTMIWCRSAAYANLMLDKARERIKDHLLHKAIELYDMDTSHLDLSEYIHSRNGIVRVELANAPLEMNAPPKEGDEHIPINAVSKNEATESSMNWILTADNFLRRTFIPQSEPNNDCNEGFQFESMKMASLVKDYRVVSALNRVFDTNSPYNGGAVEENTSGVVSKAETESPKNWILAADDYLRSIFISEGERNNKSSEDCQVESIKVASFINNYRAVSTLAYVFETYNGSSAEDRALIDDPKASSHCVPDGPNNQKGIQKPYSLHCMACTFPFSLEPFYESDHEKESNMKSVDDCKPKIFEKEPTGEHVAIAAELLCETVTVSDVRDSLEKREFILDAKANAVATGDNEDMMGAFLVHDSPLIEKSQVKKCSIASKASSIGVRSD